MDNTAMFDKSTVVFYQEIKWIFCKCDAVKDFTHSQVKPLLFNVQSFKCDLYASGRHPHSH